MLIETLERTNQYDPESLCSYYKALAETRDALAQGPFLLPAELTEFLKDLQRSAEVYVSTIRQLPQLKNMMMSGEDYSRKVQEERSEAQAIVDSRERLISQFRPLLELDQKD